jgi:hypothetical protein
MRRPSHRALQQPPDPLLQDRVGRKPDRIFVAFGFQKFIDTWIGIAGIAAEVAALHRLPVARNHRLQHITPAIGAVHVAGTEFAALQIAELVEHEQRVVAGASVMAVIGAAFLHAVGLADAAVHVEHERRLRTARTHPVDPGPGQIGQGGEVGLAG